MCCHRCDLKVFSFDEDLELECPSGIGLTIKANEQNFIFLRRHNLNEEKGKNEKIGLNKN